MVILPAAMACSILSIASSGLFGKSRISLPAIKARTSNSPGSKAFATPRMFSASVKIRPLYPNLLISSESTIRFDNVEGSLISGSRAGTAKCATSIPPIISAVLRKGYISMSFRRLMSWSTSGSARCESTWVSPCPGKCFPTASTRLI